MAMVFAVSMLKSAFDSPQYYARRSEYVPRDSSGPGGCPEDGGSDNAFPPVPQRLRFWLTRLAGCRTDGCFVAISTMNFASRAASCGCSGGFAIV
jgi:hypothetical protein